MTIQTVSLHTLARLDAAQAANDRAALILAAVRVLLARGGK